MVRGGKARRSGRRGRGRGRAVAQKQYLSDEPQLGLNLMDSTDSAKTDLEKTNADTSESSKTCTDVNEKPLPAAETSAQRRDSLEVIDLTSLTPCDIVGNSPLRESDSNGLGTQDEVVESKQTISLDETAKLAPSSAQQGDVSEKQADNAAKREDPVVKTIETNKETEVDPDIEVLNFVLEEYGCGTTQEASEHEDEFTDQAADKLLAEAAASSNDVINTNETGDITAVVLDDSPESNGVEIEFDVNEKPVNDFGTSFEAEQGAEQSLSSEAMADSSSYDAIDKAVREFVDDVMKDTQPEKTVEQEVFELMNFLLDCIGGEVFPSPDFADDYEDAEEFEIDVEMEEQDDDDAVVDIVDKPADLEKVIFSVCEDKDVVKVMMDLLEGVKDDDDDSVVADVLELSSEEDDDAKTVKPSSKDKKKTSSAQSSRRSTRKKTSLPKGWDKVYLQHTNIYVYYHKESKVATMAHPYALESVDREKIKKHKMPLDVIPDAKYMVGLTQLRMQLVRGVDINVKVDAKTKVASELEKRRSPRPRRRSRSRSPIRPRYRSRSRERRRSPSPFRARKRSRSRGRRSWSRGRRSPSRGRRSRSRGRRSFSRGRRSRSRGRRSRSREGRSRSRDRWSLSPKRPRVEHEDGLASKSVKVDKTLPVAYPGLTYATNKVATAPASATERINRWAESSGSVLPKRNEAQQDSRAQKMHLLLHQASYWMAVPQSMVSIVRNSNLAQVSWPVARDTYFNHTVALATLERYIKQVFQVEPMLQFIDVPRRLHSIKPKPVSIALIRVVNHIVGIGVSEGDVTPDVSKDKEKEARQTEAKKVAIQEGLMYFLPEYVKKELERSPLFSALTNFRRKPVHMSTTMSAAAPPQGFIINACTSNLHYSDILQIYCRLLKLATPEVKHKKGNTKVHKAEIWIGDLFKCGQDEENSLQEASEKAVLRSVMLLCPDLKESLIQPLPSWFTAEPVALDVAPISQKEDPKEVIKKLLTAQEKDERKMWGKGLLYDFLKEERKKYNKAVIFAATELCQPGLAMRNHYYEAQLRKEMNFARAQLAEVEARFDELEKKMPIETQPPTKSLKAYYLRLYSSPDYNRRGEKIVSVIKGYLLKLREWTQTLKNMMTNEPKALISLNGKDADLMESTNKRLLEKLKETKEAIEMMNNLTSQRWVMQQDVVDDSFDVKDTVADAPRFVPDNSVFEMMPMIFTDKEPTPTALLRQFLLQKDPDSCPGILFSERGDHPEGKEWTLNMGPFDEVGTYQLAALGEKVKSSCTSASDGLAKCSLLLLKRFFPAVRDYRDVCRKILHGNAELVEIPTTMKQLLVVRNSILERFVKLSIDDDAVWTELEILKPDPIFLVQNPIDLLHDYIRFAIGGKVVSMDLDEMIISSFVKTPFSKKKVFTLRTKFPIPKFKSGNQIINKHVSVTVQEPKNQMYDRGKAAQLMLAEIVGHAVANSYAACLHFVQKRTKRWKPEKALQQMQEKSRKNDDVIGRGGWREWTDVTEEDPSSAYRQPSSSRAAGGMSTNVHANTEWRDPQATWPPPSRNWDAFGADDDDVRRSAFRSGDRSRSPEPMEDPGSYSSFLRMPVRGGGARGRGGAQYGSGVHDYGGSRQYGGDQGGYDRIPADAPGRFGGAGYRQTAADSAPSFGRDVTPGNQYDDRRGQYGGQAGRSGGGSGFGAPDLMPSRGDSLHTAVSRVSQVLAGRSVGSGGVSGGDMYSRPSGNVRLNYEDDDGYGQSSMNRGGRGSDFDSGRSGEGPFTNFSKVTVEETSSGGFVRGVFGASIVYHDLSTGVVKVTRQGQPGFAMHSGKHNSLTAADEYELLFYGPVLEKMKGFAKKTFG